MDCYNNIVNIETVTINQTFAKLIHIILKIFVLKTLIVQELLNKSV